MTSRPTPTKRYPQSRAFKDIYKYFIGPIVKYLKAESSQDIDAKDALSIIFRADKRIVKEYKTVEPVSPVPALFSYSSNEKTLKEIPKNWHILLIIDEYDKNKSVLEAFPDWYSDEAYIFFINLQQIKTLMPKLTSVIGPKFVVNKKDP